MSASWRPNNKIPWTSCAASQQCFHSLRRHRQFHPLVRATHSQWPSKDAKRALWSLRSNCPGKFRKGAGVLQVIGLLAWENVIRSSCDRNAHQFIMWLCMWIASASSTSKHATFRKKMTESWQSMNNSGHSILTWDAYFEETLAGDHLLISKEKLHGVDMDLDIISINRA